MANIDPFNSLPSSQSLSVLWPLLAQNMQRIVAVRVWEVDASTAIPSWGTEPASAASLASWIRIDTTTGSVVLTLPPSADNLGRRIGFFRTSAGGNTITLTPNGADTVNGSYSLTSQWMRTQLICVTGGWDVCSL